MRESMRTTYKQKFDNILLRENGKINYRLYTTKKNEYIIHVKVPSEVIKKFYYDVVIYFYADENVKSGGQNLLKYQTKFFSNDPAFVYNYAHTFLIKKLFFEDLKVRMSKEAIKLEAKEKNPQNIVGYVKSIYFAYLFMSQSNLFNTIRWKGAEKYVKSTFVDTIRPADEVITDRQEEEKKRDKRKKIVVDKATAKALGRYNLSGEAKERLVTTTKTVPKVKATKMTKATKPTRKSGH